MVAGVEKYAEVRLRHEAAKLASLNLPEAIRSSVLQREILSLPHCLPVYGSSEMAIVQPTRSDLFFHRQADRFDVRLVGQAGDRCLPMLQELAALGPTARGKKVAVFLSPGWFLPGPPTGAHDHSAHQQFAAAFSPLQAGETMLNGALNPALKRWIAVRLLNYDKVIRARSPLASVALRSLAARAPARQAFFRVLVLLLEVQDVCLN